MTFETMKISYQDPDTFFWIGFVAPIYIILSLGAFVSRYISFLSNMASHGKTFLKHGKPRKLARTSKRKFAHFYIFGLISFSVVYAFCCYPRRPLMVEATLGFHLVRRIYECWRVHKFQSTSKMHLAGYYLGIGHYLLLPFVLLGRNTSLMESESTVIYLGILNLWLQFEQYTHHSILARLRTASRGTSSSLYPLPPFERWFRMVLCPHYLAEICMYITWASMIPPQPEWSTTPQGDNNKYQPLIDMGVRYRHWFLVVWVAVNLTVSSVNNYDWYMERYPNQSRKALVPFLF